ncbi:PolC-type DNA polymerase III [Halocella sp. SP3-1]|uniref:PolC-type DNA polymerase III n=1 Tax=Halocella sp. SP3-1 TaxID=2382161 RepID=UPI000F75CF11|nr:PolC-type DNA polymerase III [Halocella sp. SP3-1]AZO95545.1 PolC-type DNA polymerase III [Halocella sp. SP3-1]
MKKVIKPGEKYCSQLKYIIVDDDSRTCYLIPCDNNSIKQDNLLAEFEDRLEGLEVAILNKLSFEKEFRLILPHLLEALKEKFLYLNAWLERSRFLIEGKCIVIETETDMAFEKLNEPAVKSYLKNKLDYYLGIDTELEIKNGDFLEVVEQPFDLSQYQKGLNKPKKSAKSVSGQKSNTRSNIIFGRKIKQDISYRLSEIEREEDEVIIAGRIFDVDEIKTRKGNSFFIIDLTDNTYSFTVKVFPGKKDQEVKEGIEKGAWLKARGYIQYDKYSKGLVMVARDLNKYQRAVKKDNSPEKRIELHLHTKMSAMDAVVDVSEAVKRAAAWGHPAIAITDHGVVQSFPEAYWAGKKHGVKVIYGLEAYLVDDGEAIIHNAYQKKISDTTFTVFDLETTGLNNKRDEIIEIGAVKIYQDKVIDQFAVFIKPDSSIPSKITELTGITNQMVADAPALSEVIDDFLAFIGDSVLVAHNAKFDYGFLKSAIDKTERPLISNPVLDTLGLSRALYPGIKNHKLNTLCDKLGVSLENHHRAVDDATATGEILIIMLQLLGEQEISQLAEINRLSKKIDWKELRPYHLIILAKNREGLRDLYRLVSNSHIKHFYRKPRILKSELKHLRDNLLLGSACEAGELYRSILDNKDKDEIIKTARFYDFLEIQPIANNEFLLNKLLDSKQELREINRRIYQLGKRLNKPVVGTGDVHFMDPEDSIYRQILQAGQGYDDEEQAPLYFRTTEEMLAEFDYFGDEIARELVIENPQKIADLCDELEIIPEKLYTPTIEGADQEIREMAFVRAREWYGDLLPEIVEERLNRELDSIIGNGYAVIYLTSQKLVKKSLDDGYLVGSRGSVGSSLAATMTGITEVNPLPPHYRCPGCQYSEFITDGSVGVGADLPDKDCPECGEILIKDGFDIPFEVFLGFEGDKVPDIDLNFSGEYQSAIHKYTEKLFGKDYVYRAGTISSIAERTAFGFVKGYFDDNNYSKNTAEIKRLVKGCSGVKRTTGQHPGGQIVVPHDKSIYDFTPIQKPANDMETDTLTTHFDFHSIHDNLLKLDILGHDDPTSIRMLQDITGVSPFEIPLDDPDTMAIFSGTETLGVSPEEIGTTVGTLGIPEFGTSFVRQMLVDTKPTTFAELIRISGLSHGTDVWLNNAQELIRKGTAELAEVISVRDDIMNYLIQQGLEPGRAFWIMEHVRKGKGLSADEEEYMRENEVPRWYIDSCNKIKYMFPKAHAAAYVMMAFRIAYFKVHYPEAFYTTYFTTKAADFDARLICQGPEHILHVKGELEKKGNDLTAKEKGTLTILEIVTEALARGIVFTTVDIYKSDLKKFIITDKGLLPPLISLDGLGISAAESIAVSREEGSFTSIEDLVNKTRISKTVVEVMKEHGTLAELPEKNQLSLF